MEPTWPPGRLRRAQNATSNSCLFLGSHLRFISSIFGAILASKIDPKIDQTSTSAAKALQDASGQPSWSHFAPFCPHFGTPGPSFSSIHHSTFAACFRSRLQRAVCEVAGFGGAAPCWIRPPSIHSSFSLVSAGDSREAQRSGAACV